MNILRQLILSLTIIISILTANAQVYRNSAYTSYIEQYKDLAMRQQQKYKIPSSITLAQGLLESGAGRSKLATRANNHFGIKTPGGWTGPYILRDDDRPNEQFRKYKSVEESYEDHSRFLLKPRYSRLFTYKTTDYKSWAYGLKACGYATSPTYAQSLIKIIEDYTLYRYDTMKPGRYTPSVNNIAQQSDADGFFDTHTVRKASNRYYIIVEGSDNLATISRGTRLSIRKLRKYNELPKDYQVSDGDIIYLQKKARRGGKEYSNKPHVIEHGESMHDISQIYGIQLKSLYRLNNLPADYVARKGDTIWLR